MNIKIVPKTCSLKEEGMYQTPPVVNMTSHQLYLTAERQIQSLQSDFLLFYFPVSLKLLLCVTKEASLLLILISNTGGYGGRFVSLLRKQTKKVLRAYFCSQNKKLCFQF